MKDQFTRLRCQLDEGPYCQMAKHHREADPYRLEHFNETEDEGLFDEESTFFFDSH